MKLNKNNQPSESSVEMNVLMRGIAQGNEADMSKFSLVQGPRMFHTAFRLMGERQLAEDALQETFIRIWQKAPLWKEEKGSALTWAYRILTNTCIDQKRKDKYTILLDDDNWSGFMVDEPHKNEDILSLNKALKKLKKEQRILLYLTYIEGFTNKETAEITNKSVKNVEVSLSRLRKKLRRDLND